MSPRHDLLAESELTMVPSLARPPEPGAEGPPGGLRLRQQRNVPASLLVPDQAA